MKYLLWDIDGTLLLTNFAGVSALKQAIKTIYGLDNFQFTNSLAGRTDTFIAKEAIREIKGSATAEEISSLLKLYASALPSYLQLKQGHLLPNVKALLQDLDTNPAACSLLLTGNCEKGALAKLEYFHLAAYFDFNLSAFGEISELRDDLAQAAWTKLKKLNPALTPQDIIIIGDTPHDITCAAAIGARSLIVTTGSTFTTEELASYNPWKIITELPSTAKDFLSIILSEE